MQNAILIDARISYLHDANDWPLDKKCPFTGLVSIRGRILTGTVVSTKMHRTLVIRREYLHFIPKYARYEKRHKNLSAHVSPAFRVQEGDQVTVGQCRPLSKTVRELNYYCDGFVGANEKTNLCDEKSC
jgi:ribosomal protein uS17